MNDFLPFIFPMVIVVFVVASFGEMAISGMWLPAYYRYGIPLFRKEYPLTTMPDLAAKIPELEGKLKRSMWRPAIVFRALNENEIAFRNNFGSRNAMSGLIRLEPNQGRMRISGNLYWTFLLIPVVFLLMVGSLPMSAFLLVFMLAIIVMTFGMQRHQYGKIAAVIAETAVSASSVQSVTAEPTIKSYSEPTLYESKPELTIEKPIETVNYAPEFEPYKPAESQSGLNNTEMVLIIVLAALVIIGAVAAFLLLG